MQDRPNIDELLEAVQGFLRDDVMGATTGRVNFHARVAGNVIEWLRRELAHEQEHLEHEWQGLSALLGDAGALPAGRLAAKAAVEERNRALSGRIRAGAYATGADRAWLLAHLRTMTRDKLVVTNASLLSSAPNAPEH